MTGLLIYSIWHISTQMSRRRPSTEVLKSESTCTPDVRHTEALLTVA